LNNNGTLNNGVNGSTTTTPNLPGGSVVIPPTPVPNPNLPPVAGQVPVQVQPNANQIQQTPPLQGAKSQPPPQ
jgi:hypothetical protein